MKDVSSLRVLSRSTAVRSALVVSTVLLACAASRAADFRFAPSGPNADWNAPQNWLPRGVPGAGDRAFVGEGHTVRVSRAATVRALRLASRATLHTSARLTVSGRADLDGAISGAGTLILPRGASATLDLSQETPLLRRVSSLPAPLKTLRLGDIDNRGTLKIRVSSSLRAEIGTVRNRGTLTFLAPATLPFVQTATGERVARCHTVLSLPPVRLKAVRNEGDLTINGAKVGGRAFVTESFTQTKGSLTLKGAALRIGTPDRKGTLHLKGGALRGSGIIDGNVVNDGGRVQIGHSPGLTTVNGSYTQTANGILDMEIWGPEPGTGYDQLRVSGWAYLDGTMNLIPGNNFVPGEANVFRHLTFHGRNGRFSTINIVNPHPDRTYRVSHASMDVHSTTQLTATMPTPTPTPILPTISVSAPLHDSVQTGVTGLGGSVSGGTAAISHVKLWLHRFASDRHPAAFWTGGGNWTTTWNDSCWRTATVSGNSWSLPISGLHAARYRLRATVTNAKGEATNTPETDFWVSPGQADVSLSNVIFSNSGTIKLIFTKTIDYKTGSDSSRYRVHVLNQPQASQHSTATVSNGNTVTLTVPQNNFQPGYQVTVSWKNLMTPDGKVFSGSVQRTIP